MDKELKCPECGSAKVTKAGWDWRKRVKVQKYQCQACGKYFVPK